MSHTFRGAWWGFLLLLSVKEAPVTKFLICSHTIVTIIVKNFHYVLKDFQKNFFSCLSTVIVIFLPLSSANISLILFSILL